MLLAELDRFVDAMVAIRGEIDRVAAGDLLARLRAGEAPSAEALYAAATMEGEA